MTDKELIHRALMGEKRAQEECTQKRIALPCPFCGKEDSVETLDCYTAEGLKCESERFRKDYFKCVCNYLKGGCGTSTGVSKTKQEALEKWNTRPAPTVGRCKDCRWYEYGKAWYPYCNHPDGLANSVKTTDFCSYFEPKED
mgnify:FL=1